MTYPEAPPEVRVVSRDSDPNYAEVIRIAAPKSVVIVERWRHLLRKLTSAFVHLVARNSGDWRDVLETCRRRWMRALPLLGGFLSPHCLQHGKHLSIVECLPEHG